MMSINKLPIWLRNIISLLAGSSLTLSLSPYNYWFLSFIAVAVFYLNQQFLTTKQSFLNGFWFGFGLFITAVSWVYVSINVYGAAPVWLATIITTIFCAGLAIIFALQLCCWKKWLYHEHNPYLNIFSFSALWIIFELLRRWLLGGFPWAYIGYAHTESHLSSLAPIGGVYLISFASVLTSASLIEFTKKNNLRNKTILGSLIVIPNLIAIIFMSFEWSKPLDKSLSISLIQGNVKQQMKWDEDYFNYQLQLHQDMILNAKESDIILMPENAVPIPLEYVHDYLDNITNRLPNTTLITGIPDRKINNKGRFNYYNALYLQNHHSRATYYKQQLVPFGEYVPLQNLLRGLIDFFDLPMSDFAAGSDNQELFNIKNNKAAAFICYETAYADLIAKMAKDSNFLLTVSNDTWFGNSIGPWQHLQIAQMRALENARPLARATNNGISVLIDHKGKITQIADQFKQTTLYGMIIPRSGITPYMLWRDWPLFIISMILIVISAFYTYKTNSHKLHE